MIRFFVIFAVMFFTANLSQADEFGSRFTGQSPSALSSPTLEQQLQEISPAAGAFEETPADEGESAPAAVDEGEKNIAPSVDSIDGTAVSADPEAP